LGQPEERERRASYESRLAFGKGGLAPLNFSTDFIHIGAETGGDLRYKPR